MNNKGEVETGLQKYMIKTSDLTIKLKDLSSLNSNSLEVTSKEEGELKSLSK